MKIVKSLKLKVFLLFFILVGLSGCAATAPVSKTDPTAGQQLNNQAIKQSSVVLQINFDDVKIENNLLFELTEIAPAETAFTLTQKSLASREIPFEFKDYGADLGILVEQIGDQKNGTDGKYWQYQVNGQYADVGAGKYIVKPGDKIEWRFAESSF